MPDMCLMVATGMPSVVSILETRHQMFCNTKLECNNNNSAVEKQQQYHHHKHQKQMNNNDVVGMMKNGGNDETSLPCTRALALAHNNLALVLVSNPNHLDFV